LSRKKIYWEKEKEKPIRALLLWYGHDLERGVKFYNKNNDELKTLHEVIETMKTEKVIEYEMPK
jgi:hypothetical protein